MFFGKFLTNADTDDPILDGFRCHPGDFRGDREMLRLIQIV